MLWLYGIIYIYTAIIQIILSTKKQDVKALKSLLTTQPHCVGIQHNLHSKAANEKQN